MNVITRTHTEKREKNNKNSPQNLIFQKCHLFFHSKKKKIKFSTFFLLLPQVSIICCFFMYTLRVTTRSTYIYIFSIYAKVTNVKFQVAYFTFTFAYHLNGNDEFFSSFCFFLPLSLFCKVYEKHIKMTHMFLSCVLLFTSAFAFALTQECMAKNLYHSITGVRIHIQCTCLRQ